MSAYAVKELSFDMPASSVSAADGGFSASDDVVHRAVRVEGDGSVRLVDNNEKPVGSISRVAGGKVAVAVGDVVVYLRGPDTALTQGQRITGATRVITSGGTAQLGYVQNGAATAAGINASKGQVIDGDATSTANTQGARVEVLQ